jgi:hypothetical protein
MQRPLFLAMAGCFDALGVFRTRPPLNPFMADRAGGPGRRHQATRRCCSRRDHVAFPRKPERHLYDSTLSHRVQSLEARYPSAILGAG